MNPMVRTIELVIFFLLLYLRFISTGPQVSRRWCRNRDHLATQSFPDPIGTGGQSTTTEILSRGGRRRTPILFIRCTQCANNKQNMERPSQQRHRSVYKAILEK